MSRRRTVVATAVACLVLTAAPAQALFSTRPTAATPLTSGTVQPPGAVTGTCAASGSTSTATVSWGASASAFVTGYTINYTGGSTGTRTATSSPLSVTGLTKNTSYTFTVVATYRSWTSTSRTSAAVAC